jgi:hypothetical protein
MSFPKKIKILSDDTILVLENEITGKKMPERMAVYKYIKAEVFIGSTVTLLLKQIQDMASDKRLEILE